MGMRGGAGSFSQRQGGEPASSSFGGRGGRSFGGPHPGFRRGEFGDREPFVRRPSPILQQHAPAPYTRPFDAEQRTRPSEFSSSGFRGRSRDFSRGKDSARPSEKSLQRREERKAPAPLRPQSSGSPEKMTPRAFPRRQRDTQRKRLNQSQRSDRGFTKTLDTIWVRADDTAFLYVKLIKGRLHHEKLEEVKIHAAGKSSIYTAFKAVEVLTRYGYATIGSIKTSKLKRGDEDRSISKVEIVLKRTEEFEKIYEDFESIIATKREEYAKKKAGG